MLKKLRLWALQRLSGVPLENHIAQRDKWAARDELRLDRIGKLIDERLTLLVIVNSQAIMNLRVIPSVAAIPSDYPLDPASLAPPAGAREPVLR